MDNEFRVFVVDDDVLMLDMVSGLFEDECVVETFPSAEDCLRRLKQQKPDMFLLDVSMPEIDGYDLCRILKDDFETQDIPVTFISANDSPDARMLGYEAGGEDFITKPFSPDELLRKVLVAQRITANKRALADQAGSAQKTATSVMANMNDMGVLVQFFSKSFACNTMKELGMALLDAIAQYGLQGAVQLRMWGETISLSPNGQDLPLEISVLNHVQTSGRIFQFKSRCAFNHDHVTLLINNMPVDDEERCGRIRDNGSLLSEGADSRMRAIEADWMANCRRTALQETMPKVSETLDAMRASYQKNCTQLSDLMIAYQEELTRSFANLGLTAAQENFLADLTHDAMQRMLATQDENLSVIAELEKLALSLEAVSRI